MSPQPDLASNLGPLLDGLGDAAVVVDLELRPVAYNQAYLRAVGERPRAVAARIEAGARIFDLYRLQACANGCLAPQALQAGKAVRMLEIQGDSAVAPAPQGPQTLNVSATPLRDSAGNIVAVLEIYRDMTAEARIHERYKASLEAERHRGDELAEQVRLRTADLQQSLEVLQATRAQLVQSEKLKSLGQLVAGIAHELNNPINFIGGNMQFLAEHVAALERLVDGASKLDLSPSQWRQFNQLQDEIEYDYRRDDLHKLMASVSYGAERAAAIVSSLRTFVHRGNEAMAPVDIKACVEQTVALWGHALRGSIVLERHYAEPLPPVLGNAGQLSQVFMNLFSNAVHAIGERGSITVRAFAQEGGLAVDVTDTGSGMAEDVLLQVFDPFFTTKEVGKGTGLGLSISYSIVDAHRGRLTATSQPGRGSTFRVWLPAGETAHGA